MSGLGCVAFCEGSAAWAVALKLYICIYIYIIFKQYITAVISEIDVYRSSNPTAPSVHPIHLPTYPVRSHVNIFHMQHMHLIAKSTTAALAGI